MNFFIGYSCLIIWSLFKIIKSRFETRDYSERNIYSGHGSFIILTDEYFKKGGFIDGRLFLYGEEEFITALAIRNNMNIRFIPSLEVFHDEHKTIGSVMLTPKIYNFQKRAYNYIKTEYPGIY
jgi:GT2 family glycosyltransferase